MELIDLEFGRLWLLMTMREVRSPPCVSFRCGTTLCEGTIANESGYSMHYSRYQEAHIRKRVLVH